MYDNSTESDDELAAMTDRLLAGLDTEVSARNQGYARIVRLIHQMVSSEPSPNALYLARLTQRLNEEWNKTYYQRSRRLFIRPVVRYTALAASLVLVLGIGLLVLLNAEPAGTGMAGAALGSLPLAFLPILIVVVIVLALALWSRRR